MTSLRSLLPFPAAVCLLITCLGVSASPVMAAPSSSQASSPLILINGQPLELQDVSPVIRRGRLLVPMRAVFEALSAEVTYNGPLNTITAKRGDEILTLRPGINAAVLNGSLVQLDQPPIIISGRVLVPLRFVGTALGGDVSWDQTRNLVLIQVPPLEIATPVTPTPTPIPAPPEVPVAGDPAPPQTPVAEPIQHPAGPEPSTPLSPVQPPSVQEPSNPVGNNQPPQLPIDNQPQWPQVPPDFQNPIPVQPVPVPVTPIPSFPPIIVVPGTPNFPGEPNPRPRPRPAPRFGLDRVTIEGPKIMGLGDTLRIEARGTPGARASATLSPGIGVLRLREERNRDGIYTGTYVVGRGDNGTNIRPLVRLEDGGNRDDRMADASVTIDTTAPRLIASPIKRGDVLANLPDRLSFRFEDADPEGLLRCDAFLTTNRGREILTARIINNFTVELRLNPRTDLSGPLVIELQATDHARNQSRDLIDFRIREAQSDPIPNPRLELELLGVENPTNQWLKEGQSFTFRAKSTPGAVLKYSMGDAAHSGEMVETPKNSGRYELHYVVRPGDSANQPSIKVQAELNRQTLVKQTQLQVNVDTVAPAVAVVSPQPGSVLNQPVSEFILQADDTAGSGFMAIQAILTRGNAPLKLIPEVDGNRIRLGIGPRIRPQLVGPVELRVSVSDFAGNVRQARFGFVFNNNPAVQPFVRITSPLVGTPPQLPIRVSGQTLPGTLVAVVVNANAPGWKRPRQVGQFTLQADENGSWQTPETDLPASARREVTTLEITAQVENAVPVRLVLQLSK